MDKTRTLFQDYLRKRQQLEKQKTTRDTEESEEEQEQDKHDKENVVAGRSADESKHQNDGNDSSKRKRGRPSKNSEKEREWTDEETFRLIDFWSKYECLYNTKSPDYSKRDKRDIALNKLVKEFQDFDKPPTSSQVQQKITRLRCYYSAENSKIERSKTSGGDTDSVYVPVWKFFESLQFLRDNLVIRTTKSTHGDNSDDYLAYTVNNPPSLKSKRELEKKNKTNAETVMATASRALEKIESRYSDISTHQHDQTNEDKNLSDMVYTMLQSIPEGMPKAMLRLEIQQKIIQLKFGFQGVGNNMQWTAHYSNNFVPPTAPHASPQSSVSTDSPSSPGMNFNNLYHPYRH